MRKSRNEKRLPWSGEELKLLAKLWPEQGPACRVFFPGRSATALQSMSYQLGLRYQGRYDYWSTELRGRRSAGSGQYAGPTYKGKLCRDALKEWGK